MDCLHGKVHSSTLEEGMNCLPSHWSLSSSICQPHFHQIVVAIGCCSHCIFMVAAAFLRLAHIQLGNQSDVARGCLQGRSASRLPCPSTTQVIQHPRSESKGCCCLQPFKSCASELPFPHQKNGAVPWNFLPPGRFCVVTSGNVKIWKQNFKWIVALEDSLCFTDGVFLCMDDVRGYGQPNVPAFLCAVEVCFINYCSGTASLYSYTSFFNHYILGATAPEKWKTFSWHSTWSF